MVRSMCAQGHTWEQISDHLGTLGFYATRNTVLERGRRLRVSPNTALRRKESLPVEDANRDPLPPGDDRTWGLIMPGFPYPKQD